MNDSEELEDVFKPQQLENFKKPDIDPEEKERKMRLIKIIK